MMLHPHVAQPQFLVEAIEIVVQASAVVRQQICLPGVLVAPRLVDGARFHGREDTHQPRTISAFCKDLLYPIFLPHIPFAQELDLDAVFGSQPFGVLAKLIPERFGKARIIEDPDLSLVQARGHSLRVADLRKRAEDEHAIRRPSTPRSDQVRSVSSSTPIVASYPDLFGSGYAGLGLFVDRRESLDNASGTEG